MKRALTAKQRIQRYFALLEQLGELQHREVPQNTEEPAWDSSDYWEQSTC